MFVLFVNYLTVIYQHRLEELRSPDLHLGDSDFSFPRLLIIDKVYFKNECFNAYTNGIIKFSFVDYEFFSSLQWPFGGKV